MTDVWVPLRKSDAIDLGCRLGMEISQLSLQDLKLQPGLRPALHGSLFSTLRRQQAIPPSAAFPIVSTLLGHFQVMHNALTSPA